MRLAFFGLVAAFLATIPATAAPLARIDARIEIEGASAIAAHLKRILPRYLARALAQHPMDVQPGTRLVVRVTEVFLSSDLGGDGDGGLTMMDALDGEALLLDARGRILARKPLAGRTPPDLGPMGMPNEPRRVDSLAQSMAYWAVRAF